MELRLDEDHRYWYGERQIPGVTAILDAAGLISSFAKDTWAAKRGRYIHECCALLAQGRLDWSTVDEKILGYVLSYQKLLEHTGWLARAIEVQLYDLDLCFAGTFDVDFYGDPVFLFDLKSGVKAHWHKLQTAAYWHLNGRQGRRGTIYLQENGSMPKVIEHDSPNDWLYFQSFLNVYHWKEKHGFGNRNVNH